MTDRIIPYFDDQNIPYTGDNIGYNIKDNIG